MIDKSPEAITKRRKAFMKARAIAALENLFPSKFDLELQDRVIFGEISSEEAIEIVKERYTRKERRHAALLATADCMVGEEGEDFEQAVRAEEDLPDVVLVKIEDTHK